MSSERWWILLGTFVLLTAIALAWAIMLPQYLRIADWAMWPLHCCGVVAAGVVLVAAGRSAWTMQDVRDNAGWILLASLALPFPFRILGEIIGDVTAEGIVVSLIAETIFAVLLVTAIIGYVSRRRKQTQ